MGQLGSLPFQILPQDGEGLQLLAPTWTTPAAAPAGTAMWGPGQHTMLRDPRNAGPAWGPREGWA